jgi:hypothetical protein
MKAKETIVRRARVHVHERDLNFSFTVCFAPETTYRQAVLWLLEHVQGEFTADISVVLPHAIDYIPLTMVVP